MLGKELLIAANTSAPYTHLITVGNSVDLVGFVYDPYNHMTNIGSISPNMFQEGVLEGEIRRVYNSYIDGEIIVYINTFLADYQRLYLGRSDTRKNFGHPTSGSETAGEAIWGNHAMLFKSHDEGKVVPIWLSYDPPPY